MKPTQNYFQNATTPKNAREEGAFVLRKYERTASIKPSKPDSKKIAAVAPIIRGVSAKKICELSRIADMAGTRPVHWTKPKFGDFEYWLAHRCGWISDQELANDTQSHLKRSELARKTSHRFSVDRFSWDEEPFYEEPPETGEYVPEVNMKLVRDRNLTDSARRIAMFVLRHAYQDNRAGRFIGMTVSFIMKGLSLSRRTVQRSLTLLETRGYFRCEVAHNNETRMCVGLVIHLMRSLFPKHFEKNWPESRRNSGASETPQKQAEFIKRISEAKCRAFRVTWAMKCMDGIARRVLGNLPTTQIGGDRRIGGLAIGRKIGNSLNKRSYNGT